MNSSGTRKEVLTVNDHGKEQRAHQRALGVVHVHPEPQPLLRLATDLSILAILVPPGHQMLSEMVTEILDDRARLSEHERLGKCRCLN